MSNALTSNIDTAQVVLYVFWAFFFGLIWWLRREDHREGYPLETDNPRRLSTLGFPMPKPKFFKLRNDRGVTQQPNYERDERAINGERNGRAAGSTLEPIGDPMLSGVGPASFAQRADVPDLTWDGHDLIIPMRVAPGYDVNAGPDPRGWEVVATDGIVVGVVKELWVDRADVLVRYLEVALGVEEGATRLLPATMMRLRKERRKVEVASIRSAHFSSVPTTKSPDRITVLEEEKICAFYAGGRLYGTAKRLGPVV